ncbi:hypothetical protein B0T10DRAFT_540223 [Thelonectria olida]|uniref:Rhodopsin domain-containing protein n=1 Tax=Thelonectria olida TaxID=1576542 RepID=A0A9P9ALA4_9HYPO|nr:hypothetical protein B0T10DRAFT_540223 [Thelonectria olida]
MPFPAPEWTLIVVAAAVVAARVYLRIKIQKRKLLSSDVLMVLAWVSAVATSSFDIKFAQMGALDHKVLTTLQGYDGTSEQVVFLLKMFWASTIPFFTTFYLCKAALLAVYLQVFPKFMVKRRILLWATVGYCAVAYVASMLTLFCVCLPIQRNWTLDEEEACPASTTALVFQVGWALHFFGDLLIFGLPWFIVPGLQMKWKLKVGVYCTFLLGLINIIFCLVRFITIQTSQVNSRLPLSLVELWTALDYNIGLVIACLPSLRPYFRGRHGSDYPYNSNSYSKSAKSRPGVAGEGGFKMISEPYGPNATRSTASRDPNALPQFSSTHSNDDESWDQGKKSNGSDIELVQIGAVVR